MTDEAARAAYSRAAEALNDSARLHKQAEFRHRKQARRLMRDLTLLAAEAAEHGIEIAVNGITIHTTQTPGGPQSP